MPGERHKYPSQAELRRGRRKFLKQALLATLAAAGAGGIVAWLLSENTEDQETLSVLKAYYPEALDYSPTQTDEVGVGNIKVKLVNFSEDYKVDLDAVKRTLESYGQIANNYASLTNALDVSNGTIIWSLRQNPATPKILILADRSMPKPEWSSSGIGTTLANPGKPTVTFVRAARPNNLILLPLIVESNETSSVTTIIGAELCQASIRTEALYTEGLQLNISPATLIQELFCNSLGRTIALRQLGISYSDYIKIMRSDSLKVPTDPISVSYFILRETEYNSLPTKPLIVKR